MPIMSWIKATLSFINDRRHPDGVTREVETELRFHIAMRTRANVEQGMRPDDAQRAAVQSFGDFERVKTDCCEIRRSLPFDATPLKMGLHIATATLAGVAALWAVNVPHHDLMGVLRQLVAIAVLTALFVFVRRSRSRQRLVEAPATRIFVEESEMGQTNNRFTSDTSRAPSPGVAAYDEHGRTPLERVFKS
jgi:hypothetical protein